MMNQAKGKSDSEEDGEIKPSPPPEPAPKRFKFEWDDDTIEQFMNIPVDPEKPQNLLRKALLLFKRDGDTFKPTGGPATMGEGGPATGEGGSAAMGEGGPATAPQEPKEPPK